MFCGDRAQSGGQGGGAVYFGTTANFTITTTGIITANGWGPNGATNNPGGAAGGGAGGSIWFGTPGAWTNNGAIYAVGAAGGVKVDDLGHPYQAGGSGGYVFVDPLSIVNNGIIDVSDGSGSSLHGGLVGLDSANISGTGSISGSLRRVQAICPCHDGLASIKN